MNVDSAFTLQKGQVMDLLGQRGLHQMFKGQQRHVPVSGQTEMTQAFLCRPLHVARMHFDDTQCGWLSPDEQFNGTLWVISGSLGPPISVKCDCGVAVLCFSQPIIFVSLGLVM